MKKIIILLILVWATRLSSFAITCGTSISPTATNCYNTCDGLALFTTSSGNSPFTLIIGTTTYSFTGSYQLDSLCAGNYNYTLSDSLSTCSDIGTFTITSPPPLTVSPVIIVQAFCPGNFGGSTVIANGGTPPYTYFWDNGVTTADNFFLTFGPHTVVVTDQAGCSASQTVFINPPIPIQITYSVVPPTCNTCADGSINTSVSGGSAPYSFSWNTGATTSFLTGLTAGTYQICVTDANGCSACQPINCYDSTFHPISGTVFYDLNNNGILEAGEPGANGFNVQLLPDSTVSISRYPDGYYLFIAQNGIYTDSLQVPFGWHTTTPSIYNVTLNNSSISNQNFGLYPDNPNQALVQINIVPTLPRCNTIRCYTTQIHNYGWAPASGIVSFTMDSSMTYNTASPIPDSIVGNTIYWHYDSLLIGQSLNFFTYALMPGPGVFLQMQADEKVLDNFGGVLDSASASLQQVVSCSYDPNDKSVNPIGMVATTGGIAWNLVQMDTPLEYTIRFQNTGNDTAFIVTIRDTLSSNMDVHSLEIVSTSHPMNSVIDANGVLNLTFENILLPDSNVDEPGSHGYVQYRLHPKANLVDMTEISNTAYIYFDVNAPVITNTTSSFYTSTVLQTPEQLKPTSFQVVPNPITQEATVYFESTTGTTRHLSLLDEKGQLVLDFGEVKNNQQFISRNGIPAGMYYLKCVEGKGGTASLKKVIVK